MSRRRANLCESEATYIVSGQPGIHCETQAQKPKQQYSRGREKRIRSQRLGWVMFCLMRTKTWIPYPAQNKLDIVSDIAYKPNIWEVDQGLCKHLN